MKKNTPQGFSLIELMVTIAITAVLATIAIPNYNRSTANTRAQTYANQLMADLRYARGLATSNNTLVGVCETATIGSSTTCDNSATWQTGWSVLQYNSDGTISIARNYLLPTSSAANITISGGTQNTFAFNGNGMANPIPPVAGYLFTITPANCSTGYTVTVQQDGEITKGTITCP